MLTTEAASMMTMGQRAWQIEPDRFAAAWNGAAGLEEAIEAVKALGDGPVPRWAAKSRALELRDGGAEMRHLPPRVEKAA